MQTRRVPLGSRGFFLIMPGTWAQIPLEDKQAMTKRISALVKQQIGSNDRLAARRRTFRDELTTAATSAAESGAISFSIALELLAGVPFSGAMVASEVSWPPGIAETDDQAERLAAAFPAATVLQTEAGAVARVATSGVQRYVEEQTPSLDLDYWVPSPTDDGLILINVSLPMVSPDREPFIELFDSIIDSFTWEPAAQTAAL